MNVDTSAFRNLELLGHLKIPVNQNLVPGVTVNSRFYAPHMPVFQSNSNLVQIAVVVRDRKGTALSGLDRSAFSLKADGNTVPISLFTASAPAASTRTSGENTSAAGAPLASGTASSVPRYVALFFDDFSMTNQQLAIARNAAKKVAASGMAGVNMGIFTTSGSPDLDFTSDPAAWDRTLAQLHAETLMPPNGVTPGANFSPYLAELIQLNVKQYVDYGAEQMKKIGMCAGHDKDDCTSIARAQADYTSDKARATAFDTLGALRQVVTALAAQPGSRTLVLASSGFISDQTDERQQALIAQALSAGIVIDTLDAKLLETEPPNSSPMELMLWSANQESVDEVLQTLADDTGGGYYHNNDIAGAMRQAALAPEPRYILGFSPSAMPADGKFHKLQVRVAHVSHAQIESRKGYYDPSEGDWAHASVPLSQLDAWVEGPATPVDIPTAIGAGWLRTKTGATEVELQIRIAAKQRKGGDELVTAIFDPSGRFVIGRAFNLGFDLNKDELKNYSKTGVAIRFRLPLAPGVYRLRQVVYGLDTHQRTVLNRAFEIPAN